MYRSNLLARLSSGGVETRLGRHDLVYHTPPRRGVDALPLGNGHLTALVWHQDRTTEIRLNHSDAIEAGARADFRAWSWEHEEKVPIPVSPGVLRVEEGLPTFDANYLTGYEGRVDLGRARVTIDAQTPFSRTDLAVWASADPSVLVVEGRLKAAEPQARRLVLERWGSRTALHFYEQVVDDPSVRLGATEAGVEARGDGWVAEPLGWGWMVTLARALVDGHPAEAQVVNRHSVAWDLPPARENTLVWTTTVALAPTKEAALERAKGNLDAATDPLAVTQRHEARWAEFWNRSEVFLDQDYLENLYYLHFYTLFSCGLGRYPSLFTGGGWTWNGDRRNWGHLYHWNQQQLSWAVYAAGRPELAANHLAFRWNQLDRAVDDARALFGVEGAWFSDISSLEGLQAIEPDTRANLSVGAQLSRLFVDHGMYLRGLDPCDRFLEDRAAPFVRRCAQLYQNLLVPGPDGRMRVTGGTSPYESYLNLAESLTDHAAIRSLCRLLEDLDALVGPGSTPDLRALEGQLPPWPTSPWARDPESGEPRELPEPLFSAGVDHRGRPLDFGQGTYPDSPFPATLLAPVYPFACIDLSHRGTPDFDRALATMRYLLDTNVYRHGLLGCSGHTPTPQAAARLGLAEVLPILELFARRYQHFPNGFMHYSALDDVHGMGLDHHRVRMLEGNETATDYSQIHEKDRGRRRRVASAPSVHMYYEPSSNLAAGVHDMLLQEPGGVITVFPALADRDAGFRLRLGDGTEVMAERRGAQVLWLAVRFHRDRAVRILVPWSGPTGVERRGATLERTGVDGSEVVFEGRSGEFLLLYPRDAPPSADYDTPAPGPNAGPKLWEGRTLGLERDF